MNPPVSDPQIGRLLGGQFRIEELLGQGGMGRVYKGIQLSVNRAVAIKLISGGAPNQDEMVRRFRREAEATARLSHPNTVRLFDFGVTDQRELFMVMELLAGRDLSGHLKECGTLPVHGALQIARQVLQALSEAHALGIVHRDLKPGNVFLSRVQGGEIFAKVMDFGIAGIEEARDGQRLTVSGAVMGTPAYMSPEQAQGKPVDARSDLYSLGVILFEMLTGRLPFEADSMVSLLLAHVTQPPPRLADVAPGLPQQDTVQDLLDRLLAKSPDERPQTARAALELIDAFLAGLPLPPSMRNQITPLRSAAITPGVGLGQETPVGWTVNRRPGAGARLRNAAVIASGLLVSAAVLLWRFEPASAPGPRPEPVPTPSPDEALQSVKIASVPSGARVQLDGAELGKTPYTLQFRRPVRIELALAGYATRAVDVDKDGDPNRVIELAPLPAPDGALAPPPEAAPSPEADGAEAEAEAAAPEKARSSRRSVRKGVEADVPAPKPQPLAAAPPSNESRDGLAGLAGNLFGRTEQRTRREALLRGAPPFASVAAARRAYRGGKINAEAYEDAVWVLKMRRQQRIKAEKENLREGSITPQEYEWRLGRIDAEMRGE